MSFGISVIGLATATGLVETSEDEMSEYLSVSCILILSSCLLLIPALLPAAAAAVLCETIIMKHVPAECLHGLKVLSKSYKYVGGKRLPYCCCCWHRRLGRRLPTTY